MEGLTESVLQLVSVVIVSLLGVVTKSVVSYLSTKNFLKNIEGKEKVALAAVKATEQFLSETGGKEKFENAKKELISMLDIRGIKITDEEIKVFLEAAVKTMNDEYQANKPQSENKEILTPINREEFEEMFKDQGL